MMEISPNRMCGLSRASILISSENAMPSASSFMSFRMERRSTHMPEVTGVGSFQTMLSLAPEGALKMIFWEEENERTIKDVLTSPDAADADHFFIIVGPEGGLSIDEINAAREAGFMSVSLGKQILKVETAAAAIVSIIQYEKGIFSRRSREE